MHNRLTQTDTLAFLRGSVRRPKIPNGPPSDTFTFNLGGAYVITIKALTRRTQVVLGKLNGNLSETFWTLLDGLVQQGNATYVKVSTL